MLRHHDCAALPLQSGDLVVEPGNGLPIQIGCRLVQHIDFRAHGINRAKGQKLLLPTGQRKDVFPAQFLEVQCFRDLLHAAADLFRRTALIFQPKGQFAVGVQIKKLGLWILKHRAYPLGQFIHGCFPRRKPIYHHPPFQTASGSKSRDQAVDQLRHCGLSAAGGPAQQDALSAGNSGADMGKRFLFFSIAKGNLFQPYHCHSPLLYHK